MAEKRGAMMGKMRSAFVDLKEAARGRQETAGSGRTEEFENSRTQELENSSVLPDPAGRAGKVREGCKKVGLVLPAEMHHALSVKAAEKGIRLSALVESVLNEYLGTI